MAYPVQQTNGGKTTTIWVASNGQTFSTEAEAVAAEKGTVDAFGDGLVINPTGTNLSGRQRPRTQAEIDAAEALRIEANFRRGLDANGNPLPAYGTPASQGGTATEYRIEQERIGTQNVSRPGGITTYNAPATATQGYTDAAGNWFPGQRDPRGANVGTSAGGSGQSGTYDANEMQEIVDSATPDREHTPGQEQGPPTVDRTRIDQILNELSTIGGYIKQIGLSNDQYSAAQAQLAQSTSDAQKQALALARSGNRRDRAANESRAIFAGADLAAEGSRSAAILRAQEEEANKKLKLEAFTKAGELGLNSGALDLDAQQLDMNAATAYLNNVFQQNNVKMQLDQADAERVTNYIRDMALIAKDYYALDLDERQSIRDDLTRRYGIDKQLQGILEQLESEPGFFEKATLGILSAMPGAIATASDPRLKENVSAVPEKELEELLATVNPKTFNYKNPEVYGQGRNMGLMADDLQKSKYGKSMVIERPDGLHVDNGKAGLAALSGLALVYNKLKDLEKAV